MAAELSDLEQFHEDVLTYMEYLGTPAYINLYQPDIEAVALTYNRAITTFYMNGVGIRMAAITLFALTLQKLSKLQEVTH